MSFGLLYFRPQAIFFMESICLYNIPVYVLERVLICKYVLNSSMFWSYGPNIGILYSLGVMFIGELALHPGVLPGRST